MLILLPPSETKRSGGRARPLDLSALALPRLLPQREAVAGTLVALSADEDAAARVLKLSARQRGEIADNAALRTAPTMPAVDRYTGVLYDALDFASLTKARKARGLEAILVGSALFGLVGAADQIPHYRLSASSSLPGGGTLRSRWSAPLAEAFQLTQTELHTTNLHAYR